MAILHTKEYKGHQAELPQHSEGEMLVVWLCLGMFGDSFRNARLRPWTTSKAHV